MGSGIESRQSVAFGRRRVSIPDVIGFGLFVRVLAELCEHGLSAFGVEECDLQAVGAGARSLVDCADTLLLTFGQSVGHSVFYSESEVVHTSLAAVFLDELGDCRVRGSGFGQLDFSVAELEESSSHLLVGHYLLLVALEAQNVFIILDSLFKIWHGDADVFDVGDFHKNVSFKFKVRIFKVGRVVLTGSPQGILSGLSI